MPAGVYVDEWPDAALPMARAGYGAVLLLATDPLVRLVARRPASPRSRRVVRLLGVRHLAQASMTGVGPEPFAAVAASFAAAGAVAAHRLAGQESSGSTGPGPVGRLRSLRDAVAVRIGQRCLPGPVRHALLRPLEPAGPATAEWLSKRQRPPAPPRSTSGWRR